MSLIDFLMWFAIAVTVGLCIGSVITGVAITVMSIRNWRDR